MSEYIDTKNRVHRIIQTVRECDDADRKEHIVEELHRIFCKK